MFTMLHFLSTPPSASLIYVGSYSPIWIVVSVLLAIFACYAALNASARIQHLPDRVSKLIWIMIGAFTVGTGIWSMHFIGMLALSLPCVIHYDPIITLISIIPGILAGGIALNATWRHGSKPLSLLSRSILLGLGIGTMHYTGMAAMQLKGFVSYSPILFVLSILVAVALSYCALRAKGDAVCLNKRRNARVAVIMGGAVSGMHYTAMLDTYFVRDDMTALPETYLTVNNLALLITLTSVFLALLSLALAAVSRNREITKQLRDSEERWKFALEGAGEGVWDWNPQTGEALFSERWKEMLGYAEHEFPNSGAVWVDHIHLDDKEHAESIIHGCFTGSQPCFAIEYRMRCKDDAWKWILARGKVVSRDANGNPLRVIGTHTDITARKRSEESLQSSESKFRALYDSTGDAMMLFDENGFFDCNRATLELFGCATLAAFCATQPADLSPPQQPCGTCSSLLARRRIAAAMKKGNLRFEWVHRRADTGENFPAEVLLSAINLNGKQIFQATVRDITLRESEARYRAVTQSANDAIITVSSSGTIVSWNRGAELIFGYTEAEINGLSVCSLMPPQYRNSCLAGINCLRSGGEARIMGKTVEFEGLRKNRSIFPLELSLSQWQTSEGWFFSGFIRDLTERKLAEEQMKNSISLLHASLESTHDAILVVDLNNNWILHNQRFVDLWHITDAIIAAKDDAAALSYVLDQLENADAFLNKVQDLYLTPEASSFDVLQFKNGKIIERYSMPQSIDGKVVGRVWSFRDVTEHKRDIQALQRESEKNFALLRNASDGIHILDFDGNIIEVSDSFCAMLGYRRDEVIGMNVTQWDVKFTAAECIRLVRQQFASPNRSQFETCHRRKDGTLFDVEVSGLPLELDGKLALFNSSRDITERKHAETELRIAATAFEAQEGMLVTDANAIILRVNQAFTHITGYTAEEVIGKNPRLLQSGQQDSNFYAAMWESINSNGSWQGEIWNRRKNGEVYPEHLTITAVKDRNNIITNYVATIMDITLSKAAVDKIERLAFYDPLTGLPNRRLLQDRLKPALASSQRSGRRGALLFIDMDNFKILNDSLGHDMGDLLLQRVAQRLEGCVREVDTVARLGGDEFVVMLEDLSEQSVEAAVQIEVIGNEILSALNQPYWLASHEYHNTSSIGATLFNGHEQSVDELLKQADIAMYQAKASGRNALCFFDPHMQTALSARVALEADLRMALVENQFKLYYQAQVHQNGRIIGAEVLIRWQHPQRGLILPTDFIHLAEETRLILSIGQWVLETACAQIKMWEGSEDTEHLQLAVNVSARQFYQNDFVEQVIQVLNRNAINPARLKLELTESLVLDDIDDTIFKMNALRKIGVYFSMDDFGTGYSSLSSLKKLPLDQLKIDQSFVRDVPDDLDNSIIVQTIIAMANKLSMEVIAEGVETEAQRAFLEQHDCSLFQGYLFSKPVSLEHFDSLLKKRS